VPLAVNLWAVWRVLSDEGVMPGGFEEA